MAADRNRSTDPSRRERRRGAERRTHVLYTDWRFALNGHRSVPRRTAEPAEAGVDLYEPTLFALALGLFLLSAADAFFTLRILATGLAHEANPFMRSLIHQDVQLFVNLKLAITAAGILFMVPCADVRVFRLVRVRRLLQVLVTMYAVLVTYEVLTLFG
ncbi:MAG: DUF5658 family protein [Gemmatimonadetes bacterium]|nr:DUF5658 family protein [Gemmatimonadota bacterium]